MCTSVRPTREGGASLFAVCQRTHLYYRSRREIQVRSPKASAKVHTFKITAKYLQQFFKEKMKNKGKQDTGDGLKERTEDLREVQSGEGKLR